MKRKMTVFLAMGMAVIMAGCGAADSSSSSYDKGAGGYAAESYYEGDANAPYAPIEDAEWGSEEAKSVELDENSGSKLTEDQMNRKLIRNVSMDVETKEYEALMPSLESQVQLLGGYIESMESYNGSNYSGTRSSRYANLTIRIPQGRLDEFLNAVSEISNVTRRSDSVEDVTLTYVDLKSHKEALQTEQKRLLELLEKAENLEDILIIEERLTDLRYQLESMESRLRAIDNLVSYSTVRLKISEVKELTPVIEEEETVWKRISEGFKDSLSGVLGAIEDFLIWFVVHIPQLVVLTVIVLIVVLIVKKGSKKRAAKKAAYAAAMNAARQAANQQPPQNGAQARQEQDGSEK